MHFAISFQASCGIDLGLSIPLRFFDVEWILHSPWIVKQIAPLMLTSDRDGVRTSLIRTPHACLPQAYSISVRNWTRIRARAAEPSERVSVWEPLGPVSYPTWETGFPTRVRARSTRRPTRAGVLSECSIQYSFARRAGICMFRRERRETERSIRQVGTSLLRPVALSRVTRPCSCRMLALQRRSQSQLQMCPVSLARSRRPLFLLNLSSPKKWNRSVRSRLLYCLWGISFDRLRYRTKWPSPRHT